jgi:hypothetical protein
MHLGPDELTISKLDNIELREINQYERHKDTRFLPVRPPINDAYVSVVELTKSRVSFNPNPLRTIIKI